MKELKGVEPSKNSHLGGTNFFARNEGLDVEMWGCHFFIALQFNHFYSLCGKGKVSFITFQFFSLSS